MQTEDNSVFIIYFKQDVGKYYFKSLTKQQEYNSFVDVTTAYVSFNFNNELLFLSLLFKEYCK